MLLFISESTTLTPLGNDIVKKIKVILLIGMFARSQDLDTRSKRGEKMSLLISKKGHVHVGKWQLDDIPYVHAIRVPTVNIYDYCSMYVLKAYYIETLRKIYKERANHLPKPSEWEIPYGFMTIKPLIMDKSQPNMPRNIDRIPSQGERPIRKECSTCGQAGCTRNNCFKRALWSWSKCIRNLTRQEKLNNIGAYGSRSQSFYANFDLNLP